MDAVGCLWSLIWMTPRRDSGETLTGFKFKPLTKARQSRAGGLTAVPRITLTFGLVGDSFVISSDSHLCSNSQTFLIKAAATRASCSPSS